MSLWGQFMLQDANSPLMEMMIMFHDHAMLVLMMIIGLIFYIMIFMFKNKLVNLNMFEGQLIELIWTFVPILMLLFIAFPSLKILYLTDELNSPMISIKSIGHQWYWSYEYDDFNSISFDSFMLDFGNMNDGKFRLLDVDNRLILPLNVQVRMLISSLDVIHSFALPSMGVKIDAVPGRINQINLNMIRPGLYYGQCSEICGVNHSFMPIVIESVKFVNFLYWVIKN